MWNETIHPTQPMNLSMGGKQKKITLRDVAREAGVSCGAACAALRGGRSSTTAVSPASMEKVLSAANRLGYVPDGAARALRCKRTLQIGVIIPNQSERDQLASPNSYETIMGINNELQNSGYVLVLARLHDVLDPDGQAPASVLFRERMMDVAIAVGQFSPEDEAWMDRRLQRTIWCDSRVWKKTCCVRRDEEAAGRLAVEKMAEAGIRSIIIPCASLHEKGVHFSFALRRKGIQETCRRLGLSCQRMTYSDMLSKAAAGKLNGAGVLTIAFDMAQRAYVDFCRLGVRPGRTLSLCSCDNFRLQWWCFGDIARVDFDRMQMGAQAAKMALMLAEDGKRPGSVLLDSGWYAPEAGKTTLAQLNG